MKIHIDLESFSELDIKKVGGYRYAAHPSTEILMVAYSFDDGPVKIWDMYDDEFPVDLIGALSDPGVEKRAFNANFERIMFRDVWDLETSPIEWRCTMIHAWYLAFSGGLADVGKQMGLPQDKQKLDTGRKLIQKFCKIQPSNHKIRRHTRDTLPEKWEQFRQYCIGDVVAERGIEELLVNYPVPEHIWDEWFIDQAINDRGVPVDRALVDAAVVLDHVAKANLKEQMNATTGLANANSVQQLKPWLEKQGIELPNMQKETLEALQPTLTGLPAEVVRQRLSVSQTSTTKWAAFQRALMPDDRVRGMFAFAAAQRTLRWAGRLVQLHNLKRGYKGADEQVELIYRPHAAAGLFDDPLDLLSNTIRAAITAEPHRSLVVVDLSAIESRGLGWVSGCLEMNKIFAEGRDTYRAFGAHHLGVDEDQITDDQRTWYKPPVLGCGYQLGPDGLITYAEGYGVDLAADEAADLVALFRRVYHEVPEMWYWLINAFAELINEGAAATSVLVWRDMINIAWDGPFIRIELPSGRHLSYFQPEMRMLEPPWSKKRRALARERGEPLPEKELKATVTYMGRNQYTGQWTRISTHGGKITENIIQAIARDILMYHMTLLHEKDAKIVGHVHDEVIIDIASEHADAGRVCVERMMSMSPPWASDLLLGAEGFVTQRYKKG